MTAIDPESSPGSEELHVHDEENEDLSSEGSDEDTDYDEGDEEPVPGQKRKASSLGDGSSTKSAKKSKASKVKKGSLYKPLTSEELSSLQETEYLFQSSLFRMQITEMLKEVVLKETKKHQIDTYIKQLTSVLCGLPASKQHDVCDHKWLNKSGIKVPMIQKPAQVKGCKFTFIPPSEVKVTGSYAWGGCLKPDPVVDLVVVMPKDCIQEKDHLNQRYLRKRALYLAYIASELKSHSLVKDMSFTYHHGNHVKPVLLITPSEDQCKHVEIALHVSVEKEAFKLHRFHPATNNVRAQWYYGEEGASDVQGTPVYNQQYLSDLLAIDSLDREQQDMLSGWKGLKQGLLLLKVWLRHRNLVEAGLTSYILTMYVLYLAAQRKINSSMSSYQVFRTTLINMGEINWQNEGITLCTDYSDPRIPTLSDFKKAFDVVFVDSTGYMNLCAALPTATLDMVRHEAKLSIRWLETPGVDSFDVLFMTPVSFLCQHDQVFYLSGLDSTEEKDDTDRKHRVLDNCGNQVQDNVSKVIDLLQRSISARVNLIALNMPSVSKWCIQDEPPTVESNGPISFGLLLNQNTCHGQLDKGPPADSSEAAEFREFWGDKSEMRRFQDGSICEAVVWQQSNTTVQKRDVIAQIVKYMLNRHMQIPNSSVQFTGSELDTLLKIHKNTASSKNPSNKGKFQKKRLKDAVSMDTKVVYGTGEEQVQDVLRVYNELCKDLRGLTNLPLSISSIQGTSPVFRYAEVFPAMHQAIDYARVEVQGKKLVPHTDKDCPIWTPALKVLCLLEASGKWPDDLEAISRVKAAFHIAMATQLTNKKSMKTWPHPQFVDVLKGGYMFRVSVGCKKEVQLAKTVVDAKKVVKKVESERSLMLEYELIRLPLLTAQLNGVQAMSPCYGPAVRLAKRWVSAQLLLDHVGEEVIELLMAYIFTSPAPFDMPGSHLNGFLRFLHLLSRHDWRNSPIIVNLNDELTKTDYMEIRTAFQRERSKLPVMFIATTTDKHRSPWTHKHPKGPTVHQLTLVARQAYQVLTSQLDQPITGQDYKQIFRPPVKQYDVLIRLHAGRLARGHHCVDLDSAVKIPTYLDGEQAMTAAGTCMPVVNLDPVVEYLKELRGSFRDLAEFYYDTYGGRVIAVTWKPKATESHDFKASQIYYSKPSMTDSHEGVRVSTNMLAVLEDFKILGKGLVKLIETKTAV